MRRLPLFLMLIALLAATEGRAQDPVSGTEFHVDSDASWLRVLAWPDGPLKRFGHHHVISHHSITGTVNVAPDPLASTFALELSVLELVVDDPEQRALEGEEFEGEVPQDDIDGTRGNMLSENLLHGEQFPAIRIQSSAIEGSLPDVSITATYTVKGAEQTVTIPATIELTEETFTASGEIELTHDAFGLSPFTAMGGALSVRDLLVFKYEISGTRVAGSD
jgi:hypothetical protein